MPCTPLPLESLESSPAAAVSMAKAQQAPGLEMASQYASRENVMALHLPFTWWVRSDRILDNHCNMHDL